jgi:hypothetical protein
MFVSSNPAIRRVLVLALVIGLVNFGVPALRAKVTQQDCPAGVAQPCVIDSHAQHEFEEAREKAAAKAAKRLEKQRKEAEHAAHEAAEECERALKAYAHAQHEADEAKEKAARKQAIADDLASQCAACSR